MNERFQAKLRALLEQFNPRPYKPRTDGEPYPPTELEPVSEDDGLHLLNSSPVAEFSEGRPRKHRNEDSTNCYLWIVDDRGIPSISEAPVARIGSERLHHTNLTGGGKASLGGEIWFSSGDTIYLNGSSGRYPPQSEDHLATAVGLFEAAGFSVTSLGWDNETGAAMRFLPS